VCSKNISLIVSPVKTGEHPYYHPRESLSPTKVEVGIYEMSPICTVASLDVDDEKGEPGEIFVPVYTGTGLRRDDPRPRFRGVKPQQGAGSEVGK